MRRPWPSPFGRARHAHRYHRRTKRKYRAVAINGFTPEHLHVGRLAGRGSEQERERGTTMVRESRRRSERERARKKDADTSSVERLTSIGKTRRARCTDLPWRIIEVCIFRYAPVPSSAGSRCASRIDPGRREACRILILDLDSGLTVVPGRQGWQISRGMCCYACCFSRCQIDERHRRGSCTCCI